MTKREAMLAERERQIVLHPEAETAGDLAPFMGEHQREYWEWCLERTVADESGVSS